MCVWQERIYQHCTSPPSQSQSQYSLSPSPSDHQSTTNFPTESMALPTVLGKRRRDQISYAEPDINGFDDDLGEEVVLEDDLASDDDMSYGSRKVSRGRKQSQGLMFTTPNRSSAAPRTARSARRSPLPNRRRSDPRNHSHSSPCRLSCATTSTSSPSPTKGGLQSSRPPGHFVGSSVVARSPTPVTTTAVASRKLGLTIFLITRTH